MKIQDGDVVIVVLHSPREKLIGISQEIGVSGVFVRGIELGFFDEWSRAIAVGEPYLEMSDYFFPMWRIERVMHDDSGEGMPSMAERFRDRTGRELTNF